MRPLLRSLLTLVWTGCGWLGVTLLAQDPTKPTSPTPTVPQATAPAGTDSAKPWNEGKDEKRIKTNSGLEYVVLREGAFEPAKAGDLLEVHYTGWFAKDGKKFESSLDRKTPYPFTLGRGQVIKGWDEGIVGMTAGSKRRLYIPANLAYGERGSPPTIPPNADLVFEVEVVRISRY